MDIIDRAQQVESRYRMNAMALHHHSRPTGQSLTHCEDCCDAIPAERRVKVPGCSRCVDCQALLEDKLNGRR